MNRFEAMRVRKPVEVVVAPLLYPTPQWLASRMVDELDLKEEHLVLEPSAGTGALLRAMEMQIGELCRGNFTAVEVDRALVGHLRRTFNAVIIQSDFLDWSGDENIYDRIIMNPPFNGGADIRHIEHAIKFLKPGGRLVAICANGPRQQKILRPLAESWEALPADTFKHLGTGVQTALMVVQL